MTKTTFNKVCLAKFKSIAPDAYRECQRLTTPRITDVKAIPEIIKYVISAGYENNSINAPIIIGVVFSLLYPYKIYYQNIRLPFGIRDIIAKEMGFVSSEMCNHHANMLPVFAKGRWLKKIEGLADGYMQTISLDEDSKLSINQLVK